MNPLWLDLVLGLGWGYIGWRLRGWWIRHSPEADTRALPTPEDTARDTQRDDEGSGL